MSIRGQSFDAWLARWQGGTCPVHGTGFIDAPAGAAKCPREECTVVVTLWPGKDAKHGKHGWVAGPADIRAALLKAGQIDDEGKPGKWAAEARTSWPLEPE